MKVQMWPFLALTLMIQIVIAQEAEEVPDVSIEETLEDVTIDNESSDIKTEIFQIVEQGAIFDPSTGKRRYDDYQLLRVNPHTNEHLDVLQFLEKGKILQIMSYF